MKPLDDELRAVLSSRADSLPLVSDPIAGIERRARRMRRNRVAASIAGTALAVTVVAVAVPALTTGGSTESLPTVATSTTPEPSAVAASPYALDPARPWGYRGDSSMYDDGSFATFQREWAVRHPGSQLLPLLGQVYEPSAAFELVFVGRNDSTGEARWGVVQSSESGPEFLLDEPLEDGTTALPAALPGDEVARLLVTAAPEVGEIQYRAETAAPYVGMASIAEGVGITPLEGDPATDRLRILDPDGDVVFEGPAPEPAATPPAGAGEGPGTDSLPPLTPPSNVVDWPVRGTVDNELFSQALRAFARETGAAPEAVDAKVLYAGSRDDRHVMLLQAWTRGEDARTFGYVEAAGEELTRLGKFTAPGPAVLALLVPADAVSLATDLLLVVPEPAAGQVLYSADGSSEPQPVADQGTEAAVLIDRAPGTSGDRLLVLDGNGDPDRPIYRGTVEELLATF